MENLTQLNLVDGHLSKQQQLALAICFSISDRWVKSQGRLDYRERAGHERLLKDALNFVGATPIVSRVGDLAASHLSLDYHDAQTRLIQAGLPQLPNEREQLLEMVRDFIIMPVQMQDQILVLLDYLSKRPNPAT